MKRDVLLCVDDEQQVVDSLKLLFEDDFDVITYTSSKDGLEEYIRNPDIIAVISDHRMPMMNGLQMLIKMKESCPDRKTFNIIYSGYSELEGEMSNMIAAKVISEFLTKSCPTKMLINIVNEGVKKIKKLREKEAEIL